MMKPHLKKAVPLGIFVGVFLLVQWWPRIHLWLSPIDNRGLNKMDVAVYTTSWCPYCRQTRQFLDQAGIDYIEYDIEKSASAYQVYTRLGGRGVPVILIGDEVIQGYDPEKIREAIARLQRQKSP